MDKTISAVNIHLNPLLPVSWLIAISVMGCVLLAFALWRNRGGLLFRIVTFVAFMLALLNPSLLEEQREPVPDVAVVVVDQSPSQKMGQREERTAQALAALEKTLKGKPDLDLRIVKAPEDGGLVNETKLFAALDRTLADVPQQRRAGVILLTDGEVHDAPKNPQTFGEYGPVHVLLSGDKNEKDRQMVIVEAPAYGIVGQTISVKYKIEDTENIGDETADVTLTRPGAEPELFSVPVNAEQTLDLKIDHAGQNVFQLSAQDVPGEITASNNRAALIANGVRDRLRVLLVSGQPHAGGRTWRDLLTSDPGVDLVHFTILREPDKLDATPQNELSLIAFPFRELFEIKLYDFDLIIFDRYKLNRILPENYFDNIVKYVEEGGAFLEASGPSFATEDSVYYTSMMKVLPGAPTGEVIRKPFRPTITAEGHKHPVTRDLTWAASADGTPQWGHWLREVGVKKQSGETLMDGADNNPLLILDRVKEGRVAQIASDHIWLWSRGYEGGGPYTELLRRVVHWLMKEPELDEKALDIKVDGNSITIRSQNYERPSMDVTVTKPDSTTEHVTLMPGKDEVLAHTITADQLGIYAFEDEDGQKVFTTVGELNPPELRGVKTTADILKPLSDASKGGIFWLSDTPEPTVRFMSGDRNYAGHSWIGLRKNNDYTVKGVKDRVLIPAWLSALLLLTLVTIAWWREGRV